MSAISRSMWHDKKCRLILIIFIASRLMTLAAVAPEGIFGFGDYEHYFNLARLTDRGFVPFLDFWYEFPPLFPFLSILIYKITAMSNQSMQSFFYALALVMLAFDFGNLFLLMRMGCRLWGSEKGQRLGWLYLALPVGLVYTWRTFDSMTTFWILLALDQFLRGKENRSAISLGLGIMTKYIPVIMLPAFWVQRSAKGAIRYTLISMTVVLIILGPFLFKSPQFTIASVKSQASKSSWQTVWALIDGNTGTGNVGPDIEHFDPKLATKLQGRPTRIPIAITLIPFAAIGLRFFFQAKRNSNGTEKDIVIFAALTTVIFLLWSKGWSPQWQMMLFPLVLLVFPGQNGILWCAILGVVNFLEWPVLLSRGLSQQMWITIAVRTLLLLGMAVALAQRILDKGVGEVEQ